MLSASVALEGHLALVEVKVCGEGQLVVERLATAGAGVGLARVHLRVLHQVRLHHEGLGAEAAAKPGASVGVSPAVFEVEAPVGEPFLTVVARERLVARVHTNMLGWGH